MSEELYLLIKRGMYWRPNASGYTNFKRDAGRYTENDVKPYLLDPDVTCIEENKADKFAPNCCEVTKKQELDREKDQELTTLRKENARLREALEKIIGLTYDPNYTSNGHEYGIAKQALTEEK